MQEQVVPVGRVQAVGELVMEDVGGPRGSITGSIPPGIVSARRLPIPGAMPIAAAASCPT